VVIVGPEGRSKNLQGTLTSEAGSALAVDVPAVCHVEHADNPLIVVDPVHDSVGRSPSRAATSQWSEQRLTHAMRILRQRGRRELQDGSRNGLGKPLRDGPSRRVEQVDPV
jgi:hypothetical protein